MVTLTVVFASLSIAAYSYHSTVLFGLAAVLLGFMAGINCEAAACGQGKNSG